MQTDVRTFPTTSVGRLFDTAAALVGFTREITFEGQAAIWLEQLAKHAAPAGAYPFPFFGGELDFRPTLSRVLEDRLRGRAVAEIARSFQLAVAEGLALAVEKICAERSIGTIVLSGGVFQNEMLLQDLKPRLERLEFRIHEPRGPAQRRRDQPRAGRNRRIFRSALMHELRLP